MLSFPQIWIGNITIVDSIIKYSDIYCVLSSSIVERKKEFLWEVLYCKFNFVF